MLCIAMLKTKTSNRQNNAFFIAFITHSRIPSKLFGRNAKTVPVMEMILATTTSVQSSACCLALSSPLKSVRWKRQGRMIHIMKPAREPSRAMILSNEGTKIATIMIETGRPIRITSLRMPRVRPDMPVIASAAGKARASSPQKISRVLTMGRVLERYVSRSCS